MPLRGGAAYVHESGGSLVRLVDEHTGAYERGWITSTAVLDVTAVPGYLIRQSSLQVPRASLYSRCVILHPDKLAFLMSSHAITRRVRHGWGDYELCAQWSVPFT
jgi:hypothetical protein